MRTGITLLAATLLCGTGCAPTTAIVNGREVPRLTLTFVGRPYDIKHSNAHPQPGGPSSGLKDDGGHISGHVCGLDLLLDVSHQGDHLTLEGFADSAASVHLEVKDEKGFRRFVGTLGTSAGSSRDSGFTRRNPWRLAQG